MLVDSVTGVPDELIPSLVINDDAKDLRFGNRPSAFSIRPAIGVPLLVSVWNCAFNQIIDFFLGRVSQNGYFPIPLFRCPFRDRHFDVVFPFRPHFIAAIRRFVSSGSLKTKPSCHIIKSSPIGVPPHSRVSVLRHQSCFVQRISNPCVDSLAGIPDVYVSFPVGKCAQYLSGIVPARLPYFGVEFVGVYAVLKPLNIFIRGVLEYANLSFVR